VPRHWVQRVSLKQMAMNGTNGLSPVDLGGAGLHILRINGSIGNSDLTEELVLQLIGAGLTSIEV
jgi:hypothetical protein